MKTVVILFFLALGFPALSQVEFKAKVSKDAVMINEPFVLEYEINKNFEDFKLPEFENFKLISGPNTSMQQSINMINGEMTKTISVKYTYYLKALNPGTFTLKPAEVRIGEEFFYSNTTDLIVIDAVYTDPNQNKGKNIKGTEKI